MGICGWQLRNPHVAISLVLAIFSTICGESWSLPIITTVASLVFYVIVIGFQVRSTSKVDEKSLSKPHLAVLVVCTLTTTVVVFLNRHGVVEFGEDWNVGAWAAIMAYPFPLIAVQHLENFTKFSAGSIEIENASTDKAQDERPGLRSSCEKGASGTAGV